MRPSALALLLASSALAAPAPKPAPPAPAPAPAPAAPAVKPPEYSFWLVATGAVQDELREKVADLAAKYGTPPFEPHVTLIGLGNLPGQTDATMEALGDELVKELSPVVVRFTELEWQDLYFRCFYLKAATDSPLMAQGEKGRALYRKLLGKEPADPRFYPHLSLIYADMPQARKHEIVQAEFEGKRVQRSSYPVRELVLVDSSDVPPKWRMIKRWKLR